MNNLLHFAFEEKAESFFYEKLENIKLFVTLFLINIFFYGSKVFYYSLATDDYSRFFSKGYEQAAVNGRWMASIFNMNIFTGAMHILPYANSLLGIFSFTVAGFLTSKLFKMKKSFEIAVTTFLVSVTPMIAHNFFFNTNISAWIGTMLGIIGLVLLYKKNKIIVFLGFTFLVMATGTYQTIIQIAASIILVKTILNIINSESFADVNKSISDFLYYITIIFLVFIMSTVISYSIVEYKNIETVARYENALTFKGLSFYIERIIKTYKVPIRFVYFRDFLPMIYKSMGILSLLSALLVILLKKNKTNKIFFLVPITLLFMLIPIIINMPFILGNSIPIRAHFTIGWFLAGFFSIQVISFSKTFNGVKIISFFVSISILIVHLAYINVLFDTTMRQTKADIIRANNIVTMIRLNENFTTEPVKFKIIDRKFLYVTGSRGNKTLPAFGKDWSKYKIFKHFTDFNFAIMSNSEFDATIKKISKQKIFPTAYPGKNSIFIDKNNVLLFLKKSHNLELEIAYEIIKADKIRPVAFAKGWNIYLFENSIIYFKRHATIQDTKKRFFLHIYPKSFRNLNQKRDRYGFKNLDFTFSGITKDDGSYIEVRNLPNFDIAHINTGQFDTVEEKNGHRQIFRFWEQRIDL